MRIITLELMLSLSEEQNSNIHINKNKARVIRALFFLMLQLGPYWLLGYL